MIQRNHSRRMNTEDATIENALQGANDEGGADLEKSFLAPVAEWRKETGMLSSMSKTVQHPAYQKIIALGKPAVPLLLRELRDRPAHWFEALRAITKQTPVAAHERSDPKKVREAWLRWGRERGLID